MPRKRVYENAHARNAACRKRRAEREGWAKKTKLARAARVDCDAVKLYRETKRERMPEIERREAETMRVVKAAVEEADARAAELRQRGRPKRRGLPPMLVGRKMDALLNAVPEWQGQR